METNPDPINEILGELFSLLETLETQSLALTQFLKDEGIATDEKLAPYLDRAGNASSVKWRAARARMHYLLSPVPKPVSDTEKDKNKDKKAEPGPSEEKPSEEKPSGEKPSTAKAAAVKRAENPPPDQKKPESTDAAKDTARNTNANADKNRNPVAEDDAKKSNTRQKSNRK
jgi:hypothetical protein